MARRTPHQNWLDEHKIDHLKFSLEKHRISLDALRDELCDQAKALDPYLRQQILMREMLVREVESLTKRLKAIEKFNDLSFADRPTIAVAHHGTTWSRAREIRRLAKSNHPQPFRKSVNDWEWLGHGVYFWVMAPYRAAQWASEMYALQQRQSPWLPNLTDTEDANFVPVPEGQRSHFAVIEVRLRLFAPTTVNLLDNRWVQKVRDFYPTFTQKVRTIEDAARVKTNYEFVWAELPTKTGVTKRVRGVVSKRTGLMRTRDCMFFNEFLERYKDTQSILATFNEGKVVVKGINIGEKDHVQINVLDQSIIDMSEIRSGIAIKDAEDCLNPLPIQTTKSDV